MTPHTSLDPGRTKLVYDFAADRYLRSLPPEHFMEATAQATQRKITLESFDLIHAARPDVQCFNELLVQYPRAGQDPDKPGQIVPDNMVVVHHEPIKASTNFATPLQPEGPFLVLEYVSKHSARKDYEFSYEKYEKELRVPYYLVFYPDAEELTLFRLGGRGYAAVHPNAAGRLAIPEIELEVALHEGWARYWFRGELLPLPADLLRQLTAVRTQLESVRAQLTVAEQQLTLATGELTAAKGELAAREGQLTAAKGELAAAKGQLTEAEQKAEAERQARLAAEAELARLRDELARAKGS
jgi:Uma2 family endonuclease